MTIVGWVQIALFSVIVILIARPFGGYMTRVFAGDGRAEGHEATPEPDALRAIAKSHNMMVPILKAVETLNRYGLEVTAGIILGLDTDQPDTGERTLAFIEQSRDDSRVHLGHVTFQD